VCQQLILLAFGHTLASDDAEVGQTRADYRDKTQTIHKKKKKKKKKKTIKNTPPRRPATPAPPIWASSSASGIWPLSRNHTARSSISSGFAGNRYRYGTSGFFELLISRDFFFGKKARKKNQGLDFEWQTMGD
jgi:hypothetical protein